MNNSNRPGAPVLRQIVHVGRTKTGKRGLFTGNYLVFHLTDDEDAAQTAARCGLLLVERNAVTAVPDPQLVNGTEFKGA